MGDGVVTITIEGDATKFLKALSDSEKAATDTGASFGGKLDGVMKGAAAGLAGVAASAGTAAVAVAGQFAIGSIGKATDLNETISKTNVIFGESADRILEWSKTTNKAMGQSRQQSLDGAATFAIFGKSAGLAGQELVDFSTKNASLASDLASFNNTSPEEAIEAIGAALRGEAEPMRRYGVLLDDATLRQRALAMGLITTTKEALTPQQKVLAANAEMFAQTAVAQGDFARTSDGAANKQRILSATIEDQQAKLGTALLPIWDKVLNMLLEKGVPALEKMVTWIETNQDEIEEWADKIGKMLVILGKFSAVWMEQLAGMVIAVSNMASGVKSAIDGIKSAWDSTVEFVRALPGRVSSAAVGLWDGIKDGFRASMNWIIDRWNSLSFTMPSLDLGPMGKVGGWTMSVPDIPRFAAGGFTTRPMIAMIGDAPASQRGEHVIGDTQMRKLLREEGNGTTVHNTINMSGLSSPKQIAEEIYWTLRTGGSRAGR